MNDVIGKINLRIVQGPQIGKERLNFRPKNCPINLRSQEFSFTLIFIITSKKVQEGFIKINLHGL